MDLTPKMTSLRIRTEDVILRTLKRRAASLGLTPETYADMVFHYLMRERVTVAPANLPVSIQDQVYFMVQVPHQTKRRLSEWSERYQSNLAAFSGLLLNIFLGQFEHDPRDLSMIHYVSSILAEKGPINEADLKQAIRLLTIPGRSMSPDYYSRWLFSRLKPLITTIEINGQSQDFTAQVMSELLKREESD